MSENKKQLPSVGVRIIKAFDRPIEKAEQPTQLDTQQARNAGEFAMPLYPLEGLRELVKNSHILPQCIAAYKNNIAGFGLGLRYVTDDGDETAEMKAEWDAAQEIVDLLNIDMDTKQVFENVIEAREIYGIAYLEILRNPAGEVNQIAFIRDTPSMRKTYPLDPPVMAEYNYKGKKMIQRPRRFCKYRQEVGGKTVYFKEFGDPRMMDNRSGQYVSTDTENEGEPLPVEYQANEILDFAIGTELYGEVRWIGQILGIDGTRAAESLNNNYFRNGRHTPLLICIKGGTLNEKSYATLQGYMNDIKGEAGQHAFLLLETENADNRADFDETKAPDVEIKDLASILQKDELFQDYIENNRKRVQSAFQLPDLYVGYTTDFNRATAQTAMEVTEEQVFQPERKSLAWIINNRLLNGYGFKHVEVYFLEPDISNPDDLFKILTICNNAGGLTPNKARGIAAEALGEKAEDFTEDWGEVPLAVAARQSQAEAAAQSAGSVSPGVMSQLSAQIAKAANDKQDELVAIMKQVRALLRETPRQLFTKYNGGIIINAANALHNTPTQ